jgi:hypothetical protein
MSSNDISGNFDQTLSAIRQMFANNSMTIEFVNDTFHIYNRNDNEYYDIYIKVSGFNADLDITRNIVRHDDSVVSQRVVNINTYFNDIPNYIPNYILIK